MLVLQFLIALLQVLFALLLPLNQLVNGSQSLGGSTLLL